MDALIKLDALLKPYAAQLRRRYARYLQRKAEIEKADCEGGGILGQISQGHRYFGFNRCGTGIWYREWAPAAHALSLIGDFNGWDRGAHPMTQDEWGIWHLFLPDGLPHGSRLKVHVVSELGAQDRIPAYIQRVVQEEDGAFVGQYWAPPNPYRWQYSAPYHGSSRGTGPRATGTQPQQSRGTGPRDTGFGTVGQDRLILSSSRGTGPRATGNEAVRGEGLRIYEAHVGMAQETEKIGTFTEFTHNILPRIKALGYNTVQLMAIMEHPYYASFGYHVSNFFAVSSRFGTPEELKHLVDTAHGMGLRVIMDLVHSHAVKNFDEGLNRFDGTEHHYFHAGTKGVHPAWDSRCFDYRQYEVLRFLLSNIRYWLETYRFDGFRIDGVTSMLYRDHGLGRTFTDYDDYFNAEVELDALAYLMLANELVHAVNPNAISIAEEVSGMPGLARPIEEGGLGFDYRLAMGIPDYWIQLLKEKADEDWHLGEIYGMLLNRRAGEKHIAYVESHDQGIVGDKTLAMQLMDAELYRKMSISSESPVIARGIALHKLIRLITFSLGGEGYLNFMGNEFGHPEWIDFPRAGNNDSYRYARRQWSLVDNGTLRYQHLNTFDAAMQQLDAQFHLLTDTDVQFLFIHEEAKQLVYARGRLVFVFNFHPTTSYRDWRIPVPEPADYRVVLNTDDIGYGGQGHVATEARYPWQDIPTDGQAQAIQVYVPARSAQVLVKNGPQLP